MKKVTLFLFAISLIPTSVLAWNTPGEDFSGELKLEGPVTSTRNPWVWKVGQGVKGVEFKQVRGGERSIPVPLPALTVVLGKTILTTPAGREGLSPRISYGKGVDGFSFVWTEPGIAEVTLPVIGENNTRAGTFAFKMQAAGVLRHEQNGQPTYLGVYNDLNANGLPDENRAIKPSDIPGVLQSMFSGEGPSWLHTMKVTATTGVSHFSDPTLRKIEGAYGAQTIAGSGELRLNDTSLKRWQVSLPVNIEYQ
ncbi:fimbrial protein [Escherichia coli]|uniref:F4 family fimbrial subunit n=1 Tax=Escherichia coli TaxID=562 RepID=UPI0038B34400